MIIDFKNEVWKPYREDLWSEFELFKVSNYGRVKSRKVDQEEFALVKTNLTGGYKMFWIAKNGGKRTSCYVHRAIAKAFLENPEDKKYVTHLDFDKVNNESVNLKWLTRPEVAQHQKSNPLVIKASKVRKYSKLTEAKVKLIKRKINDPNRRTRMKMIAKQFGISEMQLYRIKSGENWGSVTED
ncbi:MAG: HNH endonuclease [Flavobacteriaceae bacterium]|nr:HNH endonuclease [Flavobacteriaceae bacterium]